MHTHIMPQPRLCGQQACTHCSGCACQRGTVVDRAASAACRCSHTLAGGVRQDVRLVDAMSTHSIAVTADGSVYTWGNGYKHRLGHGDTLPHFRPKRVAALVGKVCVHRWLSKPAKWTAAYPTPPASASCCKRGVWTRAHSGCAGRWVGVCLGQRHEWPPWPGRCR